MSSQSPLEALGEQPETRLEEDGRLAAVQHAFVESGPSNVDIHTRANPAAKACWINYRPGKSK